MDPPEDITPGCDANRRPESTGGPELQSAVRLGATGSHRQRAASLKTWKEQTSTEAQAKKREKQEGQEREANHQARHHLTGKSEWFNSHFLWRRHSQEERGVSSFFRKPETSPKRHTNLWKNNRITYLKWCWEFFWQISLRPIWEFLSHLQIAVTDKELGSSQNIGPFCFEGRQGESHCLPTDAEYWDQSHITGRIDWDQIAGRMPRASKNPDFPKKIRRLGHGRSFRHPEQLLYASSKEIC